MAFQHHMVSEPYRKRDKTRPIRIHSMAIIIQRKTGCDDDEAIEAAWDIDEFLIGVNS